MERKGLYTTYSQSEKLLEIGLPADSSDCFRVKSEWSEEAIPQVLDKKFSEQKEQYDGGFFFRTIPIVPCWSVGRLLQIIMQCLNWGATKREAFINEKAFNDGVIDELIAYISDNIKFYDFSRLSEYEERV